MLGTIEELNCNRKCLVTSSITLLAVVRGEICRLSFAAANIEFEDVRLDSEAWAKEKACRWTSFNSLFSGFEKFGDVAKYYARNQQSTLI